MTCGIWPKTSKQVPKLKVVIRLEQQKLGCSWRHFSGFSRVKMNNNCCSTFTFVSLTNAKSSPDSQSSYFGLRFSLLLLPACTVRWVNGQKWPDKPEEQSQTLGLESWLFTSETPFECSTNELLEAQHVFLWTWSLSHSPSNARLPVDHYQTNGCLHVFANLCSNPGKNSSWKTTTFGKKWDLKNKPNQQVGWMVKLESQKFKSSLWYWAYSLASLQGRCSAFDLGPCGVVRHAADPEALKSLRKRKEQLSNNKQKTIRKSKLEKWRCAKSRKNIEQLGRANLSACSNQQPLLS